VNRVTHMHGSSNNENDDSAQISGGNVAILLEENLYNFSRK